MASVEVDSSGIHVPVSLLETTELIASDKLVWVALALHSADSGKPPLTQAALGAIVGLCRQTVAKAIGRLQALGWYPPDAPDSRSSPTASRASASANVPYASTSPNSPLPPAMCSGAARSTEPAHAAFWLPKLAGRVITVATRLLTDTAVPVRARLLHMKLVAARTHVGAPRFTYASLGQELHMGTKSVRKAVKQLVEADWLMLRKGTRVAAVTFITRNPVFETFDHMHHLAVRNIGRAEFTGQAIKGEFLTLVVDSDEYQDNASPGFVVNPDTDELMGLDRLYLRRMVAFEFNGPQHYHATEYYDQETVDQQRKRDAAKREICAARGVELVVIHPEDLSVAGILAKVQGLKTPLPLRNLVGAERNIRYLDAVGAGYMRACPKPPASE